MSSPPIGATSDEEICKGGRELSLGRSLSLAPDFRSHATAVGIICACAHLDAVVVRLHARIQASISSREAACTLIRVRQQSPDKRVHLWRIEKC